MPNAIIDFEGFEKYGPVGNGATFASVTATNLAVLNVGTTPLVSQGFLKEWTTFSFSPNARGCGFIEGLLGSGTALLITGSSTTNITAIHTFGANYSRVIVSAAVMVNLSGNVGFNVCDSGTVQVSVWIDSSGQVNVGRGTFGAGATLFTSAALISSATRHCLEIDVTINNTTGYFQIWLDGVSLFQSNTSQNTRTTANNYGNQIQLVAATNALIAFDDLVWCDNTSGTGIPFGNWTIEGLVPTADSAVAFAASNRAVIGPWYSGETTSTLSPGADRLVLVPVTLAAGVTLSSVEIWPSATSAGAKMKGVVYSDSGGAPGSLLSSGTEVVGTTADVVATLPLVTPQALTGGTLYWVGYITDTNFGVRLSDTWSATGQTAANTYASGAPVTAPAMSAANNPCIWGVGTSPANNVMSINLTTPPVVTTNTPIGWNGSATVGQQDLFDLSNLSTLSTSIFSVKVSVMADKSDAGARTMDILVKSGPSTSVGSNSGISPATNPGFYSSLFDTDPNTGVGWLASNVDAIKAGYKVAS